MINPFMQIPVVTPACRQRITARNFVYPLLGRQAPTSADVARRRAAKLADARYRCFFGKFVSSVAVKPEELLF